jgi:hypothetical protein
MSQWHGELNSAQWAQTQAWYNQMMAQGLMGPGMTWMNGTSAAWSEQSAGYQS